jgi:hypothetical protein
MEFHDDFYAPPGPQFEPGDLFSDIPFPSLKYPLTYFRVQVRKNPSLADVFTVRAQGPPKGGDSPKGSVELRTVMLVSHGCEVDRVIRRGEPPDRRHWLAAPVLPLGECKEGTQARTREGTQPNRFYLRPSSYTSGEELCVDLRKITPINCQYFLDSARICSLTEAARKALFAHLGVFFSGYALHIQPIDCPFCGTPIDATQFVVPSEAEPNGD